MKKLIVIALLLSNSVFANNNLDESMNLMETGMESIHQGFLNNKKILIETGLKQVLDGNALFKGHNIPSFLPKNKRHMVNVAMKSSNRIDDEAKKLKKLIDKKEYLKASETYGRMINACTRCHSIVRNW